MRKMILWVLALVLLSGCAGHTVFLTGRDNGLTAQNKFRLKNSGEPVSFTLGDNTYTGHWIYVEGPGSVGIGATSIVGNVATSTMSAVSLRMSTTASGTYIGSAPDGSTLLCTYEFSEVNLKGTGTCTDSRGENYDVQIF